MAYNPEDHSMYVIRFILLHITCEVSANSDIMCNNVWQVLLCLQVYIWNLFTEWSWSHTTKWFICRRHYRRQMWQGNCMHSAHVIELSAFWEMLLCSLVGTYSVLTFWRNLPAKLHVTSRKTVTVTIIAVWTSDLVSSQVSWKKLLKGTLFHWTT